MAEVLYAACWTPRAIRIHTSLCKAVLLWIRIDESSYCTGFFSILCLEATNDS